MNIEQLDWRQPSSEGGDVIRPRKELDLAKGEIFARFSR